MSVREESLAGLDRYDGLVPGLFDTVLRLDYLDREAAEEAVYEPLDVWNSRVADDERMTVEPPLVDAVLARVPASRSATGIETSQLQLTLHHLWDSERAAGSSVLRVETLDRLGGIEGDRP